MNLDSPIFTDADEARKHLEAQRWPNGPVCPHCGNADAAKITSMQGKAHRPGLYNCKECREQFTVTVGSVFEHSKIALNKWLLATYLMSASKKGVSAHQLHRMLGVTYKTAWFMAHRIRCAMGVDPSARGPLGGSGKTVEADETYLGRKDDQTPPARDPSQGPRTGKPTRKQKVRRQKMKTFEFSIIASGLNPEADDFESSFYDNGCDDALVSFQKGHIIVDFARDAECIDDAISSAVANVMATGATIERIEPDPLVSLSAQVCDRASKHTTTTNLHLKL